MKANQNFHQQDMEMFAMVNERTALRRQRREEMELACVEAVNDPMAIRRQNLNAASGTAVRAGLALVMLGGVTRGLVDPVFAMVTAAGCALWAWGYWRRNRYGNG